MQDSHILPFLWMRGEAPEVLREEIKKIHDAGIGAVCLESRPHPDYAGDGWWHDLDIVIGEAQKYGMQIWILDDSHFPTGAANNQMALHPEQARRFVFSQFVDVTGPIPAAQVDVDLMLTKQITWVDLGKPVEQPLYKDTRLLSVTAARIDHQDVQDGYAIDLTSQVRDGYLTWDVPEGVWRIRVAFDTTAFGAKTNYINYIDADSVRVLIDEVYEPHWEHYKDLFGTVIAGFFSDEPGFYNIEFFQGDNKIGATMPLPWGREMEQLLSEEYGPELYRDLPLLFAEEKDHLQTRIRTAYMDCVSRLYSKNFSQQLGNWCRAHGVQYIGHIVEDSYGYMRLGPGCGHYFRAMAGQDIAGIDNIGYQLMPGNDRGSRHTGFQDLDPEFYHYGLARLGASEAAIDPKKKGRLLCENFGAYGWRLGVRDMKWLVDYLVGQGVNYFVPHAFSMAEYPDVDCPPHFYARGNNPEFPYFCHLMRYTDRLCNLFSDGQGVVQAGVLFEAESDWAGEVMPGHRIGKELIQNQIDFLFLPSDALADENCCSVTEDGRTFSINGSKMQVLIVPECEYLPTRAARFITAHPTLPVIYLNHYPIGIAEQREESGTELLESAIRDRICVPLSELAARLQEMGITDEIHLMDHEENLHLYRYIKGGRQLCHLMNVSVSRTVDVRLHLPEGAWRTYDAMHDVYSPLAVKDGIAHLVLPPYGAMVLECLETGAEGTTSPAKWEQTGAIELDAFTLTLQEIGQDASEVIENFAPQPISSMRSDFAGVMEYHTTFTLDEIPDRAVFSAEHVYECMSVSVNGTEIGYAMTPPYDVDVTSALWDGTNEIVISVASTPLRNANTKPGIFGKERTILEPTGMFGRIAIELYSGKGGME